MIEPSDAEVNAAIRASFEPKIPRDVMPKPGPTARHNFRAGYRAGITAGIERAAQHMESESTNTAIKIRALLK